MWNIFRFQKNIILIEKCFLLFVIKLKAFYTNKNYMKIKEAMQLKCKTQSWQEKYSTLRYGKVRTFRQHCSSSFLYWCHKIIQPLHLDGRRLWTTPKYKLYLQRWKCKMLISTMPSCMLSNTSKNYLFLPKIKKWHLRK